MNVSDISGRKEQIIRESARLFREKGFIATSIRDISESLNMTSAALYYHFKNKEEILLAIMIISLNGLIASVEEAVENEKDTWEKMRAALRTHLRGSLDNQDFAYVLLKDLRHLSPEWQSHVVAKRDQYDQYWDQLLDDGQKEGLIKPDVDLEMFRLMTFGAINLAISWYKSSGRYSPEEIADIFLTYLTEGVRDFSVVEA
ncbi:MAG: TetR/AcrR family transcriptional regulator [Chloroflexota bacterium]